MIIKENQIDFFIFFIGYGIYGAGISIESNLDVFYLLSPIVFFYQYLFLKKKMK